MTTDHWSLTTMLQAQFFLPSVDGNLHEGKPPISLKFEIPYFTTSGIQVTFTSLTSWSKFWDLGLYWTLIVLLFLSGAVSEDHREVWVPSPALGAVHNAEWRLPAEDTMKKSQMSGVQKMIELYPVNLIVIFALQSRMRCQIRMSNVKCVNWLEFDKSQLN